MQCSEDMDDGIRDNKCGIGGFIPGKWQCEFLSVDGLYGGRVYYGKCACEQVFGEYFVTERKRFFYTLSHKVLTDGDSMCFANTNANIEIWKRIVYDKRNGKQKSIFIGWEIRGKGVMG